MYFCYVSTAQYAIKIVSVMLTGYRTGGDAYGHLQGEKYMTASVFDCRKPRLTLCLPFLYSSEQINLENTHLVGPHFWNLRQFEIITD